jgi:hypothetical protein
MTLVTFGLQTSSTGTCEPRPVMTVPNVGFNVKDSHPLYAR